MREVNVSSVRRYRQIGASATQPTESEIGDVHDQETAGAASEDRPDEQGEDVVQQPDGMTKTTPKAKKPGRASGTVTETYKRRSYD
jgi:hypothetical protein